MSFKSVESVDIILPPQLIIKTPNRSEKLSLLSLLFQLHLLFQLWLKATQKYSVHSWHTNSTKANESKAFQNNRKWLNLSKYKYIWTMCEGNEINTKCWNWYLRSFKLKFDRDLNKTSTSSVIFLTIKPQDILEKALNFSCWNYSNTYKYLNIH